MMRKTYFMRVYNITFYLFIWAILILILSQGFRLFRNTLDQSDNTNIKEITLYVAFISKGLYHITFYFFGIALFLVGIDLVIRLLKDKITNHIKSVYHTVVLRRYIKLDVEKIPSKDDQQKDETKNIAVKKYFNKVVGKSLVDVRQKEVFVAIKTPRKHQAHKILNDIEDQIYKEITYQHPDYYFSAPERQNRYLWFKGQRR
ncbi:hypothetical protein RJC24_11345 [Staphylococcus epidermidis]|uniref:hypothetical protein n=1 Tax=Staphylococcus epidermidis TaxID=1282 RepID=UPI0028782BEF|nr:hypothetical protein [Staphylococcus epidermidis]MDS3929987.1 hypothetical protein [Staphylococcus epidermidis]